MELKRRLVESLIFPHFDYCDHVYGGLSGELGDSLQLAQNACVRYVCNLERYDHVSESYSQLGWLKLDRRREVHALILLFKILHSQKPQYLRSAFRYLSESSQYSTRSLNTRDLEIPLHRSMAYGKSFHVRAARLWNSIHIEIRNALSATSFKVLVTEHLYPEA
ncbi:hypothetical protein M8J77_022216 [Diaphorina citri]|nr:hypothetical protein M8J77_022216 [Diaphorina citri]